MTNNKMIMEYATDFDCGVIYEGKVCGSVLTERKHIKFLIVELADGRRTQVHRRSFLISQSLPEFYHQGDPIQLVKVGFMDERHLNKWHIYDSRRYDLSNPEAIKLFLNHDERLLSQTISPRQKNNKVVRMRKPFKKALKDLKLVI